MSNFITTFEKGTEEREKLEIAAVMLTNRSPNHWRYMVGETYFDLGQNWKWTTVMCWKNCSPYQALCPREQEEIVLAETYDELVGIVNGILADKFCPDKAPENPKANDKPYDGSFNEASLPYLGW